MINTAIRTTTTVGRATVFAIGLAVMVAVVLGAATTANAAAGDPLKLGKLNAVNKLTQLVGGFDGAMLRIDNNSIGPSATALELQVESGKPPMKVNSSTEVQGLNVDQVDSQSAGDFLGDDETAANSNNLDGKDSVAFFSGKTYLTLGTAVSVASGQSGLATARCDPGDAALSGGYNFGSGDNSTVFAVQTSGDVFNVHFRGPRNALPNVTCADFPPLR